VKAIVIREFGPPEVMRLEDVPTPEPGPGEVLVRVHAVSVNRTLDLILRAGAYSLPVALPHVLGVDPAGVVSAVGPGVDAPRVGERVVTMQFVKQASPTSFPVVLGLHVWGGYAEYVKVPAAVTHPIPGGVDFASACVVSRHAPVALSMLRDGARLKPGEWVLVMGAAGGLGSAGVQAAKVLGAKVIAAAGAPERVRAALALGADAGVDYRAQDLTDEVMRITGGRGVDVVFENIADPALFPKAFASLARNGRLITAGAHGGGTVPLDVKRLYLNAITVIGSFGRILREDVDLALGAAADGRYKALIDRVLPLELAPEAHRLVAERAGIGKIVLQPTPEEAP
jgi:NADPH:quinone reductase